MRKTSEIGLKITAAQREYYRYTGVSAEIERSGAGCSRPEQAWIRRIGKPKEAAISPGIPPAKS